ncbi:MAG: hypothetical protein MK142_01965 [Pseudomonadales bacterium]|nr:hypothetical protein [Pseudomonadales bacterium]
MTSISFPIGASSVEHGWQAAQLAALTPCAILARVSHVDFIHRHTPFNATEGA